MAQDDTGLMFLLLLEVTTHWKDDAVVIVPDELIITIVIKLCSLTYRCSA